LALTGPILWEPPEGPREKPDLWVRIIAEVIEDYPEADIYVTREEGSPAWTVLAICEFPERRVLEELTRAIARALKAAGLPATAGA
jgi:hypothetical protein